MPLLWAAKSESLHLGRNVKLKSKDFQRFKTSLTHLINIFLLKCVLFQARFKGFHTEHEALDFIQLNSSSTTASQPSQSLRRGLDDPFQLCDVIKQVGAFGSECLQLSEQYDSTVHVPLETYNVISLCFQNSS